MNIVKLGGSLITDKSEYRRYKRETVQRLATELFNSNERTIVVHGAGSFGHIIAKEHSISSGYKDDGQWNAVARIHRDVRELNQLIMNDLLAAGSKPISIPPLPISIFENKQLGSMDMLAFENCIDSGMMPVTFGDVVFDKSIGFCIVSGDELMYRLAAHFKPDRAIFAMDVDGLFDKDPKKYPDAKLVMEASQEYINDLSGDAQVAVADVTGSIYGKVRAGSRISALGIETMLINGNCEGMLENALSGKNVKCTKCI